MTQSELVNIAVTEHKIVRHSLGSALMAAKRCGEALIALKPQIKARKEKWTTWIQSNLNIEPRTAQDYMDIARNWAKYLEKQLGQDPAASMTTALLVLRRVRKKEYKRVEKDPWQAPAHELKAWAADRIKNYDQDVIDVFHAHFDMLWDGLEQGVLDLIEKRDAPRLLGSATNGELDQSAQETEVAREWRELARAGES